MPKVDYSTVMDVPRAEVWEFVRDINNWAPFATGYQHHEIINEQESVWTVKGEIGPISRTTKFHIVITEWAEEERVGFTVQGVNEPISGEGVIRLTDADTGAGTKIRGDVTLEFGGSLGPVVNHLIGPWAQAGADDLVTKIAMTLQPSYVRPRKQMFLVTWLHGAWQLLRRVASAAFRARGQSAPPSADSDAVAAHPVTRDQSVSAEEVRAPLRVETLLLGPSYDQYSGGGASAMRLDGIAAAARKIEELGFDGVTTPEAGHDPFLPLAVAAEHTERISLGTNVAIAFPRSPMVVAQIAWDLQQFSAGRFRLGLGTQVKGHNERRYSAPWTAAPGPRLREYVLCLKAMFQTFQSGERPSFSGQHYQFTLMSPFFNPGPIEHPDVPIYISALNKYMARLAGELCDGLRLHPLGTFKYTKEVVLPAIEAGVRKAGRQLSDVDIVGTPFIITGKDEAEVQAAKEPVRQQIAFYASTRTYHSVLEFHGWSDVGPRLHQLSLEGKWQDMRSLISDEMLQEFAIIGTYDELVPKLKEQWGGICSTIFLALPPQMREDEARLREIVRRLRQP